MSNRTPDPEHWKELVEAEAQVSGPLAVSPKILAEMRSDAKAPAMDVTDTVGLLTELANNAAFYHLVPESVKTIDRLRHFLIDELPELRNNRDRVVNETMLMFRHINEPCPTCGGWGVRAYGSTATWHGGIGGAAITSDVCDKCWGSGDAHRHWPDRRKMERDARSAKTKETKNG